MSFGSSKWLGGCALGLGATVLLGACQGPISLGGADDEIKNNPSSGNGKVTKVDVLFVVDNSAGMADKQEILGLVAADFVKPLVNPPCVDQSGAVVSQPAGTLAPCPAGSARRYAPVNDMHIGVISSSIGGHGTDACPDIDPDPTACGSADNTTMNDKGHLLTRPDACGGPAVPTYGGGGFIAWDPGLALDPPGENVLDDGSGSGLVPTLGKLIRGAGEIGCGYEAPLESWYRFLAEPAPYVSMAFSNMGGYKHQGLDTALLEQRKAFLRPDSMLVIVMLTDENDCSVKEYGQFPIVVGTEFNGMDFAMPRARSECAIDPNDPCCKSCALGAGDCPVDPTCYVNGDQAQGVANLSPAEDPLSLRCFDQKRRFGIEFLYPIDRYTSALTQKQVYTVTGELVDNPIFSDLDPNDGVDATRDPGLVVFAGIAGVPWQAIARDPSNLALGFKDAQELAQGGTWDAILGDPTTYVAPTDPFMVESVSPRAGITAGNAINGGERTIAGGDDLQYACTFPLLPGATGNECDGGSTDNPICAPNPADGGQHTLQIGDKAYPGTRVLGVARGLGERGVLGSICPAQVNDPSAADFGYRPAIQAVIDRMAPRL